MQRVRWMLRKQKPGIFLCYSDSWYDGLHVGDNQVAACTSMYSVLIIYCICISANLHNLYDTDNVISLPWNLLPGFLQDSVLSWILVSRSKDRFTLKHDCARNGMK